MIRRNLHLTSLPPYCTDCSRQRTAIRQDLSGFNFLQWERGDEPIDAPGVTLRLRIAVYDSKHEYLLRKSNARTI
jgi:hypothetical protein